MIKVNTSFLSKSLQNGLDIISQYESFKTGSGIKVFCQETEKDLKVTYDRKSLYIACPDDNAFYRGFGYFLQNSDKEFTVTEGREFKKCGMMFDSSRNGVLNMKATKYLLVKMALMGMNTYYPYMEDVYELKSEPLFGYRRGRYTRDDLKEIDDFAYSLGIEVIPCIETLAHLNQFLQIDAMGEKYRDIDDIITVGEPQTKQLVDDMIHTMSDIFRSRNIHVGLDEARNIGKGKYLEQNGYKQRKEVLAEHVEMVSKIADRYGMHVQMWDDMFFRTDEYDGKLPSNVTPVFWDYYQKSTELYERLIDRRLNKNITPIIAGGAWRWANFVPQHGFTYETSEAFLAASKSKGVEEVFVTSWGDDGDEGPAASVLFGMTFFAEHAFNKTVSREHFDDRLTFFTGMDAKEWWAQEKIEVRDGESYKVSGLHKAMLYSDPICGVYDAHIEEVADKYSAQHFVALAAQFRRAAQDCAPELKNTQLYYACLCDVLELKWNLGMELRKAYNDKDRAKLLEIRKDIIDYIIPRLEAFRKQARIVWEEWYGMYGFEVIDIRLGGLAARLKTIVEMIYEFDEGKLKVIPPLEEELRKVNNNYPIEARCYFKIASSSKMF